MGYNGASVRGAATAATCAAASSRDGRVRRSAYIIDEVSPEQSARQRPPPTSARRQVPLLPLARRQGPEPLLAEKATQPRHGVARQLERSPLRAQPGGCHDADDGPRLTTTESMAGGRPRAHPHARHGLGHAICRRAIREEVGKHIKYGLPTQSG